MTTAATINWTRADNWTFVSDETRLVIHSPPEKTTFTVFSKTPQGNNREVKKGFRSLKTAMAFAQSIAADYPVVTEDRADEAAALASITATLDKAEAAADAIEADIAAIDAAIDAIETREAWLLAAAELIRPLLVDRANLTLPSYRVTCGWPSKGGRGAAKRVLGECWAAEASADSHAEIFISPMEDDRRTVLAILAHELIHACLPAGTGHKRPFCLAAGKLGFVAPFTKLMPTEDLYAWADEIIAALPEYPHARLNGGKAEGAPKKQTTRMIKASCTEDHGGEPCGYQVRLTRKWIEEVGAPICPRHNLPMVCEGLDMGDEDEDQDDGEG